MFVSLIQNIDAEFKVCQDTDVNNINGAAYCAHMKVHWRTWIMMWTNMSTFIINPYIIYTGKEIFSKQKLNILNGSLTSLPSGPLWPLGPLGPSGPGLLFCGTQNINI